MIGAFTIPHSLVKKVNRKTIFGEIEINAIGKGRAYLFIPDNLLSIHGSDCSYRSRDNVSND